MLRLYTNGDVAWNPAGGRPYAMREQDGPYGKLRAAVIDIGCGRSAITNMSADGFRRRGTDEVPQEPLSYNAVTGLCSDPSA